MIAECLVVAFDVEGDDCPLSGAARETGDRIDARPPQLRSDDNALLRFSTPAPEGIAAEDGAGTVAPRSVDAANPADWSARDRDVDPSRFGPVAEYLDNDDRVRYLHASRSGDRINYRCLSKHPCAVHELTDAGFVIDSLRYGPDGEMYTGAVVGYDVLRGVLDAGVERSGEDGVGITVRRIHPLGVEDDQSVASRWSITPAQEAALRTALELGYFSVPREADAGDVADELGISKSAFLERLRRGQAGLLGQLL